MGGQVANAAADLPGGTAGGVLQGRGTLAAMDAIDRILGLLDEPSAETAATSMRMPRALRDAASIAVAELGAAPSTTALTAEALRARLEAIVMEAALEDHFRTHPQVRPSLAEQALAAAQLDGHPLAARPELLEEAAAAVVERHPNADADDVLLWAEGRASAA